MVKRTDQTVTTSLQEVEELWRRNAGKYELWWDREWRVVFHADISSCNIGLKEVQFLHRNYPFYQGISVREVLSELRSTQRIFIGNLLEASSESYWKPWVDVGGRVEKERFEQRYYWLEGFLGMSHAAISGEVEIAKVQALARELKFKLHRIRIWE